LFKKQTNLVFLISFSLSMKLHKAIHCLCCSIYYFIIIIEQNCTKLFSSIEKRLQFCNRRKKR